MKGGYRATKKDLKYLKKWKRGESIGFTMRSSLKAKGLIPRANGTRKVSNKYRKGGACACSGAGAQFYKLPLAETFKAIGGACACAASAVSNSIYNLMPRLGGNRRTRRK